MERARTECTMHKDINTRMQREIQTLEHELQDARNITRRLQSELDHSSKTLKDRDRSVRDKVQVYLCPLLPLRDPRTYILLG